MTITTFTGHSERVVSAIFSSGSGLIASASYDNTVKLWNPETGEVIRTFSVELTEQNWLDSYRFVVEAGSKLAFSPDDKILSLGSGHNALISWNVETGEVVQKIQGEAGFSIGAAFSPDGTIFASPLCEPNRARRMISSNSRPAGYDEPGTVGIWDVGTGVQIDTLSTMRAADTIVFSSDNQFLGIVNSRGKIELWNLNSKQLVHQWSGRSLLAISPDRRLVAGDVDGSRSIKIWNLSTGEEVLTMEHSRYINDLVFSPDNKILASASVVEGNIKLWNTQTGEEMLTLLSNEIFSVAISPDSRLIAGSNFDHTVRVWRMP
jgi:WD40 repeat protein